MDVFATEPDSLQITWAGLPSREATFEVAGRNFDVDASAPDWYRLRFRRRPRPGVGGPGSLVVSGLDPDTTYEIVHSGPAQPRRVVARGRTLPPVPGRLLTRLATISDCHIGERRISVIWRMSDPRPMPPGLAPYPVRSALAAIREAEAWGAELIVAKGDLTREAEEEEAEEIARILRSASVPVEALLGNHDVQGPADVTAILNRNGIHADPEARAVDLAGVRLIIGHSPEPGLHGGRLDPRHIGELVSLAGAAPGPVIVALHHPPRRRPWNTYYPPAISWDDSKVLMKGLAGANPNTVLVAGHTHRNRRYRVGGITVAEVGSTKDYPGQWAGYAIHEGGIRQVVRRTTPTDVIAWTESTKRALGGVWGWWSPGRITDRCWTLEWV